MRVSKKLSKFNLCYYTSHFYETNHSPNQLKLTNQHQLLRIKSKKLFEYYEELSLFVSILFSGLRYGLGGGGGPGGRGGKCMLTLRCALTYLR